MTAPTFSVSGQQVLVVGAARSGVAAASLLAKRGARVTLTDRKPRIPEEADLKAVGVALELGGHQPKSFETADLIVVSPGVRIDLPELLHAKERGVPVIGELELASRWLLGPIVAITGTKGKSTTTTLVGRMLEAAGKRVLVGGNIGVPVSAQVEASTADTVHVIEASSFQLESTDTFRPWIAALLNFSPDHLDQHPDEGPTPRPSSGLREPSPETGRCQCRQRRGGDDEHECKARHDLRHRPMRGFTSPAVLAANVEGDIPLLPLAAVQLRRHCEQRRCGDGDQSSGGASGPRWRARSMVSRPRHVMSWSPPRQRALRQRSKATNVDAAAKSIESFDKVVAIIGGKFRRYFGRSCGAAS